MATGERVGTASSRPLVSGPQSTLLAVSRRLPRGHRRELPPNKRFILASGRRATWSRSARTPAYIKSFYSGRPADKLVATGKDFDQQLSFRTADPGGRLYYGANAARLRHLDVNNFN